MYNFEQLKSILHKFSKYIGVGAMATSIYLGLLYLLTDFAGIYYIISAILSFCVSTTVGFFGHKYFTFRNKEKKHAKQMIKFFIIAIVGVGLNTLGLYALVEGIGLWYIWSAAITSAAVFVANFILNNIITFRETSAMSEIYNIQRR